MLLACCAPFATAQHYDRKVYSVANGMPGSNIENIFEDSKGYLWVSSFAALLRYDGTSFTKFGEEDGLTSIANFIFFEDSKQVLWGASDNGTRGAIIKYSHGKFETLPFDKDENIRYIFALYESASEGLMACTDHGLRKLQQGRWVQKDIGLDNDTTIVKNNNNTAVIRALAHLPDGSTLICTPTKIIKKLPNATMQVIATAKGENAFYKMQQVGDRILITSFQALFIYQGNQFTQCTPYFTDRIILASCLDRTGKMYLSCTDASFFTLENGQLTELMQEDVKGRFTKAICADREKNIWVGNLVLARLRTTPIEHFEKKDGLDNTDNRGLIVAKNNDVYFGSASSGFNYWDKQRFTSFKSMIPASEWPQFGAQFIYRFAEDVQHRIYMMSNGGSIYRYANKHAENLSAKYNPTDKYITQIVYNLADSCMYVAVDSLLQIKNDVIQQKIGFSANGKKLRPIQMRFDTQQRLWVGISNGDVAIIDSKTKRITYAGGIGEDIHLAFLMADPDGTMWAGTDNWGLLHLTAGADNKAKRLPVITTKDGLYSNYVTDALYDRQGWLWVLAAGGITRFNLHRTNADGSPVQQRFGKDDGLDPYSYVDSHIGVDSFSNIWISTYSGIYRFKNGEVPIDTTDAYVHIEKVLFNNAPLTDSSFTRSFTSYFHLPVSPVLPYNKDNFTIGFNCIAFTKRDETECEYQLEGLETKWTSSELRKEVSYANLKAGAYLFKVRARRKNGTWGRQAVFAFTITPPYWETWWFRTLLIAAASAMLILVFRSRIAQVNRKAKLQNQLLELEMQALKARMNPHFIYNAMNSIQSLVMNDEPERAVRYVGKFAKLLRQVLDNSDSALIPLDRELSSLQLYIELEALRLHVDFAYQIEVDNAIQQDEELLPPLVLQPYIENALWHGLSNKQGAKNLNIHIYPQADFLLAEITDNGIGRKKAAEIKSKHAKAAASKGLDITKRRLSILNNENIEPVAIEDLYDLALNPLGTKVTVRIRRTNVG